MVHLGFHGNCGRFVKTQLVLSDNMGSGCNVVCNPSPIKLQLQFPDCLLLLELLPLSQYSIALIRQILAAYGIYQVSVLSDCMF